MNDTQAAREAIAAIRRGFATSSQDWSAARDGIYLNGIAGSGWEPDPDDPDAQGDVLMGLVHREGWTDRDAQHIRAMRAGFTSIPALLDELDQARTDNARLREELRLTLLHRNPDGTHGYTSTYCVHGDHDACRLTCKTCVSPCACPKHQDNTLPCVGATDTDWAGDANLLTAEILERFHTLPAAPVTVPADSSARWAGYPPCPTCNQPPGKPCLTSEGKPAAGIHEARTDDEHPEDHCNRCGGPNISWCAPSPLWNEVMRGGDINGPWQYDEIICPTCFAILAEKAGIASMWRLHAERITRPLQLVTPSGRTWNEQTWLWEETAQVPHVITFEGGNRWTMTHPDGCGMTATDDCPVWLSAKATLTLDTYSPAKYHCRIGAGGWLETYYEVHRPTAYLPLGSQHTETCRVCDEPWPCPEAPAAAEVQA